MRALKLLIYLVLGLSPGLRAQVKPLELPPPPVDLISDPVDPARQPGQPLQLPAPPADLINDPEDPAKQPGQQLQAPPPPQEGLLEPPPFGLGPGGNCGLVTKFAGHKIGDGCLQEALNITYDADVGVQRREGYGQFNTSALTGAAAVRRLYPFTATDGTQYVMAISSDKIYSAGTSGTFTAVTGLTGLSQTENTACKQGLGRFWCVNQSNGLFFWNGSSTGTVSAGPLGNLLDLFRNRVLVANVSGNQSRLYGSGFLDGENWTTGAASTSPFIISIGGTNDGDRIKCLMGTFNDAYVIGTETRLYALYGFDNDDFSVRELSREVGCIDNTSVQEMDGALYWLSRRGVERMRGTELDWKVSYPIINLIQPIIEAAGNSQSAIDTVQADFQAGNLIASGAGAPLSATIVTNSVVPSSWTGVDTSSSDFSLGSVLTITTTSTGGGEITSSGAFVNSGFELCDSPVSCAMGRGWTTSGAGTPWLEIDHDLGNSCSAIPWSGTYGANGPCAASFSLTVEVLDGSNNVLYSNSFSDPAEFGGCTERSIDISTQTGSTFKLRATSSSSILTSATIGKVNKVVYATAQGQGCSGSNKSVKVDFPEPFYLASSTFTSRIFDVGFATPTFGNFTVDLSSDSRAQANFRVQSSTANDGGGFETVVNQSPGADIGAAQRRYIRYTSTFNTDSSSRTATINSVSLAARTTGYAISQCRNPGSSITSWGLFQCNTATNGGSFSFAVSTGATCHAVTRTTATWNTQVNNSIIGVPTAPYVAYRTLFDLGSDGDNEPALQDCTINWESGASRPEVASGIHDHRYHLFYTTSTAASPVNTNALVLDQFDRWSQWDNIPARSATTYRTDLLIGDGSATGKIYRLYTGNDDNGSSFTSRIRTKDFDLGNWRTKKQFGSLWLELSPENDTSDDVDMVTSAYVDVVNKYTLGTVNLDEDTGVIPAHVPWPLDTQSVGRYISIEVSNVGTQPWRLYRGALRYRSLRED